MSSIVDMSSGNAIDAKPVEKDKSLCKPEPSNALVLSVLAQYWDIHAPVTVSQLESYDDANFYIRSGSAVTESKNEANDEFLIKFYNAVETENTLLLQGYSSILNHIDQHVKSICVPVPIPLTASIPTTEVNSNSNSNSNSNEKNASSPTDLVFLNTCPVFGGTKEVIAVRLFVWVKGKTLNSWTTSKFLQSNKANSAVSSDAHLASSICFDPKSQSYIEYLRLVGRLSEAVAVLRVCLDDGYKAHCLAQYNTPSHPAFMNRVFCWDIRQYALVVPYFKYYNCEESAEEKELHDICEDLYRCYRDDLLVHENELNFGTIQGDCNDANVVVRVETRDQSNPPHADTLVPESVKAETVCVAGIIDFGDTIYSYAINEFLITVAYALLSPVGLQDPDAVLTSMISAYHRSILKATGSSFSAAEIRYFRLIIALRLSTSVTIGHYSIIMNPENREYLELHATPAKKALKYIWRKKTDADFVTLIQKCCA